MVAEVNNQVMEKLEFELGEEYKIKLKDTLKV